MPTCPQPGQNGYKVVPRRPKHKPRRTRLCVHQGLATQTNPTPSKVVCSGPSTNQPITTSTACGMRQGCALPLLLLQGLLLLLQATRRAQPQHCCCTARPCTYVNPPHEQHMRALPERRAHFPPCCANLLPPYTARTQQLRRYHEHTCSNVCPSRDQHICALGCVLLRDDHYTHAAVLACLQLWCLNTDTALPQVRA